MTYIALFFNLSIDYCSFCCAIHSFNVESYLMQVRDETDTRIDVPSDGGTDNTVVLTIYGTKDGIDKAKQMIEATQTSLVIETMKLCSVAQEII